MTAIYEGDTNNNGASYRSAARPMRCSSALRPRPGDPPVTVKAKCKKKKRKGKSAAASKKKGCKKKKKR